MCSALPFPHKITRIAMRANTDCTSRKLWDTSTGTSGGRNPNGESCKTGCSPLTSVEGLLCGRFRLHHLPPLVPVEGGHWQFPLESQRSGSRNSGGILLIPNGTPTLHSERGKSGCTTVFLSRSNI